MESFDTVRGAIKASLFAFLFAGAVAAIDAQSMMKASPQTPPAQDQVSISGTIAAIKGVTLFVTTADGNARAVAIGKDTLILARETATLDSIQPGDALGVAAEKGEDGSLTATAINVFPAELWQRVRKGQFPMANGQVMTNAQVDRVGVSVEGRTLFLKYDMLTAAISVPAKADIHRSRSLKLIDLKTGEKVSVRGPAGNDGVLAAATICLDLTESS